MARTTLGARPDCYLMDMTVWTVAADGNGNATSEECPHLSQATDVTRPERLACEDCLREGTRWVHLRQCLACGHTGCCDSSPRRHASRHWRETSHALARSLERGEQWAWCFPDELFLLEAARA